MRRFKSPAGGPTREDAASCLLIVDSSPATRQALAELLAESGYVVHTAGGAQEMVALCRELATPPDLVLLEFRLHDGRGDLAASFARKRWPELAIVFLSCVSPDQDAALNAALLEARTALLLKPTSLADILRIAAFKPGS